MALCQLKNAFAAIQKPPAAINVPSSNSIAHVVQTLDLLEFSLIAGAILRRGVFWAYFKIFSIKCNRRLSFMGLHEA